MHACIQQEVEKIGYKLDLRRRSGDHTSSAKLNAAWWMENGDMCVNTHLLDPFSTRRQLIKGLSFSLCTSNMYDAHVELVVGGVQGPRKPCGGH